MTSATRLLWDAAGQPAPSKPIKPTGADVQCYVCGLSAGDEAVPATIGARCSEGHGELRLVDVWEGASAH